MLIIEQSAYYGMAAQTIFGEHLRIVYLTGAGPRLVGLYLNGDERNFLAELPELSMETPNGRYYLRGGHRLWAAPEDFPMTYLPDNEPPQVEILADGVRLSGVPHPLAGLQKRLEFRLHPDRPALTVHHWIENQGASLVELAPWSITQLPTGGVAYLPQHSQALDASALLPNRVLVLWPGTDVTEPRLSIGGPVWQVRASGGPRLKVGYLNLAGWMAYVREGRVFVKRLEPKLGVPLPDMGANAEVYTDDHMIELETLGPVVKLFPGESVQHSEIWEIYSSLDASELGPDISAALR